MGWTPPTASLWQGVPIDIGRCLSEAGAVQHHDGIENRQEPERVGFAGLVLDLDGRSLWL